MPVVELSRRLVVVGVVAAALVACGAGGPSEPAASRPATAASPPGASAPLQDVPPLHPSVDDYPETEVTLESADGDATSTIRVKVADTRERRSHGLMEVEDLPDGTGMLFTYEEDTQGAFYMKDTLVPLDIAFVDRDGAVIATFAMDPCESEPCPTYGPDEPFRAALEVPQGWLDEHGIDVDDTITWGEVRSAP